jgi:hypothetical protein
VACRIPKQASALRASSFSLLTSATFIEPICPELAFSPAHLLFGWLSTRGW